MSGGEDHPIINFLREQKGGYGDAFLYALCERPRPVNIRKSFYIDIYETTNKEYRYFVWYVNVTKDHKTFCHPEEPRNKSHVSRFISNRNYSDEDQPVVGIDWFDAYAYARFARKSLPTDDQWEVAARGKKGWLYPWGNTFDSTRANISHAHIVIPVSGDHLKEGATPDGIRHLAGNVSEWTLGQHQRNSRRRSLRGGGCYDKPAEIFAMSYLRFNFPDTLRKNDAGFRCVSYASKLDTLPTLKQVQSAPSKYPGFTGMANKVFTGSDDKEYWLYFAYKYYHDQLQKEFSKRQNIISGTYQIGGPEDSWTLDLARKIKPSILEELAKIEPKPLKIKSFLIDSLEVTNKEYAGFLNDLLAQTHWYCHPDEPGLKDHRPDYIDDERFNGYDQPVVGVDWWDAYAYARFQGKRLPTKNEWEFAARGIDAHRYPWGNEFRKSISNTLSISEGNLTFLGAGEPKPGIFFPKDRTSDGVYNLGGNVAEWTATIETNDRGRIMAVLKGGHFKFRGDIGSLTFTQSRADREVRDSSIGFRCATDY